MKSVLLAGAALMALFVIAESLTCHSCRMELRGKCLYRTTEVCDSQHPNCYWGRLTLNVSSWTCLYARGCMATNICNQTHSGHLLTAGFTVVRKCCDTDFCNGASSVQLPMTVALGSALLAVGSNWYL